MVITSETILDTGCATQDLTSRDKKQLVLSEVSQTETDKYYMISCIWGIWASQVSGLPSNKESVCQCRRHKRCRFNPWVGKIPWSREWQHTPVFLPGRFHGEPGGLPSMGSQRLKYDWTHTHMRNLKNCINELICKTERLTDIENKLMITIGEGEAEG